MIEDGLVTVIIPTYKATQRLQRAINSVLFQSYDRLQIIVVDDNAPDSEGRLFTENLMKQYDSNDRVTYIKHDRNKNGAAARNTGLNLAKGEYCAFLDDDDMFYYTRVEECVKTLRDYPEYDAVYSDVDMYVNDSYAFNVYALAEGYAWKELLLNESMLGTGSNIFLRRSCFDKNDRFDEHFLRYQDIEFMLRVLEGSRIKAINSVLVRKNIEPTNIPKFGKFRNTFLQFIDKYKYMIDTLSDEEKYFFYNSHYRVILYVAINSKKRSDILQAQRDMKRFECKMELKDRVKCWFPYLYGWYQKYKSIGVVKE